jgi:hypothetical protein
MSYGAQFLRRQAPKLRERKADIELSWLADFLERNSVAMAEAIERIGNGTKGRGGTSKERAAALAERNAWLRSLRDRLPAYRGLERYPAAKLMLQQASRYERDRWPREKKENVAPIVEPARTFWKILKKHEAGGPKMPTTAKQLAEIIG